MYVVFKHSRIILQCTIFIMNYKEKPHPSLRSHLHEIIFEADTPAGKAFDIVLIFSILISVIAVMLDSVESIHLKYDELLVGLEWFFTLLFTVEYGLRLYSVKRSLMYARSFYGIVDLLAILPTYLSLIAPASRYLLIIRILRLLRVFRVLKLVRYLEESENLLRALRASSRKITVFLLTVLTLVTIFGCLLYVIEGEEHGFTSIPRSMYWAIVTLTTVGYGDISPQTALGQTIAAMIMIFGYAIIAVPTGIVTVELSRVQPHMVSTQSCPNCGAEGHDSDAKFCKHCGASMAHEA